jgi:glucosamine--fructose-6-phosphate aminotransferase (isomerizing)
VVLAISQSGETADTRAAVLLAKDRGVPTIGIVNVPHSTIAREVDTCILLRAGLERSVASTKACVSQSVVCALLALTRCVDSEKTKELSGALLSLSSHATALLASFDGLDERIKPIANAGNVFCLGRGGNYGVALEAALKLKEVAYIHAEGYPGGELKHGSLALIDGTVPTLAFLSIHPVLREKLLSNISDVIARGGEVIAVSAYAEDVTTIQVPQSSMLVESIIHTIAAHYITYRVGVIRGTPIDKPRNLAKAVTVE